MFELHPILARDCDVLGDFPLSRLLLMNDANYPWLILVPRRDQAREVYLLSWDDQQQLLKESAVVCQLLEKLFSPDKLNLAALGNMVPQLHIHHIARREKDAAWPGPVWGAVAPSPYSDEQRKALIQQVQAELADAGQSFSPGPGQ